MRRIQFKFIGIAMVFLLVVTALGFVLAQDDAAPPALGIAIRETDSGAMVAQVYPDSPAEAAGLQHGDVITAVNGEAVSAAKLSETIQSFSAGDSVTITVTRGDETLDIDVTLEAYEIPTSAGTRDRLEQFQRPMLGVSVADTDQGVVVNDVVAGSAADEAGIETGDIIVTFNGEAVATVADLQAAVGAQSVGDTVTVEILRDGEAMSMDVELGGQIAVQRGFGQAIPNMHGMGFRFENGKLFIENLSEDNPLYEAGLRAGDAIVAVNGQSLGEGGMFNHMDAEELTLTVERGGETLDITIPAGTMMGFMIQGIMPGMMQGFEGHPFGFDAAPLNRARLGVTYQTLDEQAAAEFEIEIAEGAYIVSVEPNSPADAAGLQEADIVVGVNGDVVDFERTLAERIYAYSPGDVITLDVLRGEETLHLEVTLGAAQESTFFGMPGGQFGFQNFGPGFHFMIPGMQGFPFDQPSAEPTPEEKSF